jgi:hypothetical protein
MFYVFVCQRSAFAVFEPFLCGLVAADVEIPSDVGNVIEILNVVYPNFAGRIFRFFYFVASRFGEIGYLTPCPSPKERGGKFCPIAAFIFTTFSDCPKFS